MTTFKPLNLAPSPSTLYHFFFHWSSPCYLGPSSFPLPYSSSSNANRGDGVWVHSAYMSHPPPPPPFTPFNSQECQKSKFNKNPKFHFAKYKKKQQMIPCKSTAKEVSFEWSRHRISSTGSKVRTTLHVSIIDPGSESVNLNWFWCCTWKLTTSISRLAHTKLQENIPTWRDLMNTTFIIHVTSLTNISTLNRSQLSWRCSESGTTTSLVLRHRAFFRMTRWTPINFAFS